MTNEPDRETEEVYTVPTAAEKGKAHRAVQGAIAVGMLTPGRCEVCMTAGSIVAHHPDYSSPLLVEWLCRSCHARVHHVIREYREKWGEG